LGLRANISVVPVTDTSPSAQAVLPSTQRALSGEQRLLLAFEMSWFVPRIGQGRNPARTPGVARRTDCARTSATGIPSGTPASPAPMSIPDLLQTITVALDQAGIGYKLSGSFASAYYRAPRSTKDIDLVVEATPAPIQAFLWGPSTQ
jgi:hypothetical protein